MSTHRSDDGGGSQYPSVYTRLHGATSRKTAIFITFYKFWNTRLQNRQDINVVWNWVGVQLVCALFRFRVSVC
jgi:hypothetical protein